MIRLGIMPIVKRHVQLGQEPSGVIPERSEVQAIAESFPRCFSSRTILPAVDRAMALAAQVTTAGLPPPGGGARVRRDLSDEARELGELRDRLATEPVTRYCADDASGPRYAGIREAVLRPYRAAYAVGDPAALRSVQIAIRGDLRLAIDLPGLRRVALPTVGKIAIGAGVLWLLARTLR